jgi:TonB family protein
VGSWFSKNIVDPSRQAIDVRQLRRWLVGSKRYAAWMAVLLLHAAAIIFLARSVITPSASNGTQEVMASFVAPRGAVQPNYAPVPEPAMDAPTAVTEVEVPDIHVDQTATSSPGNALADILPPRPDPGHSNPSPLLPAAFAKLGAAEVVLTIQVSADGGVSDASVAKSSGQAALDALAIAFAKAKWRFRAAMQGGRPVSDLTTIIVRFVSPASARVPA